MVRLTHLSLRPLWCSRNLWFYLQTLPTPFIPYISHHMVFGNNYHTTLLTLLSDHQALSCGCCALYPHQLEVWYIITGSFFFFNCSVSCYVLINGESKDFLKSTKGLKAGGSTFTLCFHHSMEIFWMFWNYATSQGLLHGFAIQQGGSEVTHLQLADDYICWLGATSNS